MQRRSPLTVFLLSCVTLGIYALVWTYKTRREMLEELHDEQAIPPFIWLLVPWLAMLGVAIVAIFIQALIQSDANPVFNVVVPILIVACVLAALVYPFVWFYKFSEVVHRLVPQTEATMIYVLWVVMWFVGFPAVWPLVVQSELNKYNDKKAERASDGPAPAVATYPVDVSPRSVASHAQHVHHRTHSSKRVQS